MGFRKGEQVVAVKDIGGFMRDLVPKGSQGIVVDCGWATPTKVQFTVKGGLFSMDKKVTINVSDDEIR